MGIDTIEVLKFFVTAFSFVKYGKAVKLKWPDPWIEVKFIKTTKGAEGIVRKDCCVVEVGDAIGMKRIFREMGYVVVAGVMNKEEVEKTKGLVWDYIEGASSVKLALEGKVGMHPCVNRDDPKTWAASSWPDTLEGGIFPHFGVGHSRAAWFVRTRSKVQQVFEGFWGAEAHGGLLASFDSMLLWRSGEVTDKGWFHIDQNPATNPGFQNVQGLVNLVRVVEGRGGNVVVPKSHSRFAEWAEHEDYKEKIGEVKGDDWMEVWGRDAVGAVCLELLEGDMLLWDSRLVHCSNGVEGGGGGERQEEVTRAAVLVTMYPKNRVGSDVRGARMECVARGETGTHWANRVRVLGAERGAGREVEDTRVKMMRDSTDALVNGLEGVLELGGLALVG
ncbi:hypothetical protein TrRE_jg9832 [Triparma retinervis]|uniref:Uncharacterized protein n=1 Tax=Triparma retinervis TaxID=2557542 RepID=A0A9W6ZM94_9STRA|nr:hypothetical protein TrRE_jg9832 [Triparma retinervis]